MKTVAKCAAIAGVLVLTAGSAAWAQTSTTMSGTPGSGTPGSGTPGSGTPGSGTQGTNQGYYTGGTQGYQGTYSPSQGTYGTSQGTYGANQGSWNTGTQGTSTPYTGQTYSHSGYGTGNLNTYQEAEQQLGKYGYSNVQDLRAMQGWSADAMKNGQRVHVILGDNGLVATFPGR